MAQDIVGAGAGDGTGTAASLANPARVVAEPDGLHALVTDSSNCAIRRVHLASANVTTIAGHCEEPSDETMDGIGLAPVCMSIKQPVP